MPIHLNTLWFLFGFLASIGIGYVGMKLILAARAEAIRARVHREHVLRATVAMDHCRQQLHERVQ